jgi:hypothetical protein
MVVTKVTAFSRSRQHSRGRLTTVAVVVVVTKVTLFQVLLYTTTTKTINKKTSHFRHRPFVAFLVTLVTSNGIFRGVS